MSTPTAMLTQIVETAVTDSPERPPAEAYGHRDEYPVSAANKSRIIGRDRGDTADGWVHVAHFVGDGSWQHERICWR